MYQLLVTNLIIYLKRYFKPIVISVCLLTVSLFVYHKGYTAAETKYKLERAKEVEIELNKLKALQNQLQTEKEKNYALDVKFDEAIKSDNAYNCPIPPSLRSYLNAI